MMSSIKSIQRLGKLQIGISIGMEVGHRCCGGDAAHETFLRSSEDIIWNNTLIWLPYIYSKWFQIPNSTTQAKDSQRYYTNSAPSSNSGFKHRFRWMMTESLENDI